MYFWLRIQDFSLGVGVPTRWGEGALTSDAGTFRWKRVRKRKNWLLLRGGGEGRGGALADPPLIFVIVKISYHVFSRV